MTASKSQRRARLLAVLGVLGGVILCCLSGVRLVDITQVEQRLTVTPTVHGGAVQVTGVAWRGESGVRPWPIAGLWFDLELHSQDTQALEVASTQIIAHDALGRRATGTLITYGASGVGRPVILFPGEIRPMHIAGIALPLPLTWTRAEIQVTLKPAEPDTLRQLVRWHDFVVQTEQTDASGRYSIQGTSAAARQLASSWGGTPYAVVSFYNAHGEFVRGGEWTLGGGDYLDETFTLQNTPRGPVTHARVFFVENVGEELTLFPTLTPTTAP